ncbi:MAG: glycosyltransferase N-terminal domain-containing protein [Candidatus Zixiibacteriota bacterium]
MKYLYVCFTWCYVAPLTIAAWVLHLFGNKHDLERLGRSLSTLDGSSRPVWLVASSVGEVTIALKIIERLKRETAVPVILSVTTATGRARAIQAAPIPDVVFFHPFDTSANVTRTLRHFHPQLIVLVETELWPVLMERAFELDIKIAQVSGRISDKSFRRYLALRPFFAPLLRRCSLLLMQSEDDAARIRALAGDSENIAVIGSVKEDYLPPDTNLLSELRSTLSPWNNAPIFTCGSTRPAEEEILCDAYALLLKTHPGLRMVIAPRHLDRCAEVEAILKARNLSYQRWTSGRPVADTQVLLLDTIGKLNAVYHLSLIAFVGGTLAPLGGHNLLEPALAGCPVLHGPHFFEQIRGHELLHRFEMDFEVSDAADIIAAVSAILNDSQSRANFAAKAANLRNASSHVLDEYIDRLLTVMSHE